MKDTHKIYNITLFQKFYLEFYLKFLSVAKYVLYCFHLFDLGSAHEFTSAKASM